MRKRQFTFVGIFLKTDNFGVILRKTQTEGHSKKYPTSTPQNCQSHEKQGEARNCQRLDEIKETWLNAMWVTGLDSRTEKGHKCKN